MVEQFGDTQKKLISAALIGMAASFTSLSNGRRSLASEVECSTGSLLRHTWRKVRAMRMLLRDSSCQYRYTGSTQAQRILKESVWRDVPVSNIDSAFSLILLITLLVRLHISALVPNTLCWYPFNCYYLQKLVCVHGRLAPCMRLGPTLSSMYLPAP